MSEELKAFYKATQEWIEAGCTEHPVFAKDRGLCDNLYFYAKITDGQDQNCGELLRAFRSQVAAAGLHKIFPFNRDHCCFEDFIDECNSETVYENKDRLAWIKEHAK